MADLERLRRRAEQLKESLWKESGEGRRTVADLQGSVQTTLSILAAVYGPQSTQMRAFQDRLKKGTGRHDNADHSYAMRVARDIEGAVGAAIADLEAGIASPKGTRAKGEVLGDFVTLAREALDRNDSSADRVAAVLAAGALEETLKQLGMSAGLDVYGRPMRAVIEKLKEADLLSGPEFSLAHGLVGFRDKALHAQFDDLSRGTTESALAFVEAVLLSKFA